ncbi:coiled-coil-helix-coiled-coil-helix domain-containing protein 2-like [Tropilaelaps mercedesae]|uniref:Coiled-coil-helix-coiled-coil-helix domain-containing protein 2-like n=1 Tax=Tropilaelaps mercedesae TaxID=418985 RepID=A0A1V9XUK1_9ACAR|nr:coiled-coil-helix-coiled-coil-helix domain-containing protein 2-like [Tropilaelaps mercedesae]
MVRRRQAPAPPARAAASAPPRTQVAHVPPTAPAPVMASAPQQPGMFAQMATTAAGVAVGSAVGHTVGHALTGAFSGGSSNDVAATAVPASAAAQPAPQQQQSISDACSFEMKQFVECAQNQHDISLCQGFNEVLKACKQRHGIAM